jgi:AcrR family transcriptional regulator
VARCLVCRRELQPADRGRPPRYCSRACRAKAYRSRVAERAPGSPDAGVDAAGLSRTRVVAAAIALADRDGSDGLSMRRVATALEAGVMSLYRYVRDREELIDLMIDAIFGERPLPEPGPDGWRAKLEHSARAEWAIYQRHPWAAPLVAVTTRPPIAPNLMAYTDWRMRALDGLGLDFTTMLQTALTLSTYLQGAAITQAHESGLAGTPREQWRSSRQRAIEAALQVRELPMVSRFGTESYRATEPDAVFEFGLRRVLAGIDALIERGDLPARRSGD